MSVSELHPNGTFDAAEDRKPKCPLDFITSSRYIFFPNPAGWVKTAAQNSGRLIKQAVKQLVGQARARKGTLLEELKKGHYMEGQTQWQERAVATAISGFMAATIGSFLSVMAQWIKYGDLWRHQQRLLKEEPEPRWRSFLADEMVRAMRRVPFPDLLYRTVIKEKVLLGGSRQPVSLQPGDRVVVSLASASAELPEFSDELLFGGTWKDKVDDPDNSPVHPCPGRELALGVMLGMISGIMDRKDLREEGTLVLSTSD